ncbi:DUF1071 domain-containing protein [Staphylococcus equorum]|uniref:Sak single strand annealing protein n=1 Tax=Staphylococcus equorum TaxID=246432 RepID=UPI0020CC15B4|nr:DUF1071 domain-containing protein [Staphylococcus equorum]UTT55183.1 DUF1071 domain-containing protein [Staphylococcus equorum]UTT55243.1 DUF1071 domain-containing protein [Staphylococcus equorum]
MTEQTLFQQLNAINVSDHVEKKNNFNYLAWTHAHEQLKKIDPDYKIKTHEFPHPDVSNEQIFVPYLATPEGYFVQVSITVKGVTESEWLPVLDFKNKSLAKGQATTFDINKAHKRCFVKAAALHGLGLYIYNGEDMPEQPFVSASEDEIKQVNDKVKQLAPLMKINEAQLKKKMNIPDKISTQDAEESLVRLDNGIKYYNKKDDK